MEAPPGTRLVDVQDLDVKDCIFPDEAYVLSGELVVNGQVIPQTFLSFEYSDEHGAKHQTSFAIDTWQAIKLGLSLGQASVGATEEVYKDRLTPSAAPTRVASPYI